MAKNTVSLDLELEFDFEIIPIVSSVKEYKMCFLLNNLFGFDMYRMPDLEIMLKRKKKTVAFNVFHHYDDIDKMDYYLISNKYENELLLPELKIVDYVLKLDGFEPKDKKTEMIHKLKNVPQIQAVIDTSINELKDKTHLLF
jgi:hypothetical protein